jgi:hypothetical protein
MTVMVTDDMLTHTDRDAVPGDGLRPPADARSTACTASQPRIRQASRTDPPPKAASGFPRRKTGQNWIIRRRRGTDL